MTYEEKFEEWWNTIKDHTYYSKWRAKQAYLAGCKKGEEKGERLRQAITESLADNLPYLAEKRLREALDAEEKLWLGQ